MYKPIFDLWSTNRSRRHRRCLLQNHPPISSLSDPPTNPTSFKPTHWSVVLYLSLSLNLSPSLSHDRCLFFSKIEFFLCYIFCWFGLYIWISYYNIFLEVEKIWEDVFSRGFSKTFFVMRPNTWKYFHFWKKISLENILHSEIILHWAKYNLNSRVTGPTP